MNTQIQNILVAKIKVLNSLFVINIRKITFVLTRSLRSQPSSSVNSVFHKPMVV